MTRLTEPLRRRTARRAALVLACAAMAIAPPAFAHWTYIDSYASGTYGVGGTFSTPGYGHRHLERVYHQAGTSWCTWYHRTSGADVAQICNTANPTEWWVENDYAKTQCHNVNDSSGTRWTCQTTVT
jgi:hypothetical protein